jgi:hypothetical protein
MYADSSAMRSPRASTLSEGGGGVKEWTELALEPSVGMTSSWRN